jgi:ABC-type lipoprotein export system ATPase subunit
MTEPGAGTSPSAWTGQTGGPGGPGTGVQHGQAALGAEAMIVCDRLVRIYTSEGIEVQALQGLDLLIAEEELTALIGAAGSGKTTLMNILAGLDIPTAGTARVAGHDLAAATAKERLAYRRSIVGFTWQQASRNLLSYMTARQNVMLPMRFGSLRRRERMRQADFLLDTLGITHCADRTPDRMSGGEQQRAAIATALANQPKVLLADEPTGELDSLCHLPPPDDGRTHGQTTGK